MAHCKNGHAPIVWDNRQSADCPACLCARLAMDDFAWKLKSLVKTTGKNIGPIDINLVRKSMERAK